MHEKLERTASRLVTALLLACAGPALAQGQTVVIEGATALLNR